MSWAPSLSQGFINLFILLYFGSFGFTQSWSLWADVIQSKPSADKVCSQQGLLHAGLKKLKYLSPSDWSYSNNLPPLKSEVCLNDVESGLAMIGNVKDVTV